MAFWLHTFALISFGVALITGNLQTPLTLAEKARSVLNTHETLSYITGWYYVMLWLWLYLRKNSMNKWERSIFTTLFIGGLGLLSWTAWLGGRLVYQWGAGVVD